MSSKILQFANSADEIFSRAMKIMDYQKEGELAKRLNVAHGTFSTWKKRNSIPFEILLAFCEQERINFQWLLTGAGEPRDPSELPGTLSSSDHPTISKIVEMLRDMDDEELRDFEGFVKEASERAKIKRAIEELTEKVDVLARKLR